MEDIPWLPLAMVFIAFLSWLRNRIKEAAEIRRARNAAKAEIARARRTTAPAKDVYQSPYREEPAVEVIDELPKSFRELFDEINAREEAATAAVPPPLPPAAARSIVHPEDEEEPWGDGDGFGGVGTVPPLASTPPIRRSAAVKKKRHSLAETLSNGGQLRNALILKEVLGPPKALQNRPGRTQR